MSQAVARVTLTRVPNGVIYQSMITCSTGDIRQLHNDTTIAPDFEKAGAVHPVLTFHCIMSSTSSGEVYPQNCDLYLDGTKMSFNASGLSAAATISGVNVDGMFQKAGGGSSPITVTVKKNYVTNDLFNQADHMLKMVCQLSTGETVQAMFPLTSGILSASGEFVSIVDAGTGTSKTPFVVDQNAGTTCVLKAQVYKGGDVVNPGTSYTFQWQKMSATGWTDIAGATSQTYTVVADAVESYAEYRVVVTPAGGGDSFSDTQSIMDVGDPYFLSITCKDSTGAGAELQFAAGEAETSTRVLKAVLYDRKNNQEASKTFTNNWQLVKPDGVVLNPSPITCGSVTIPSQTTNQQTITIPHQYLINNGINSMDVYAVASY